METPLSLLLEIYVQQPVAVVCRDEETLASLLENEWMTDELKRRPANFYTLQQLLEADFASHCVPRTIIIWQTGTMKRHVRRDLRERFPLAQVLAR